jgi:hypothetical protein
MGDVCHRCRGNRYVWDGSRRWSCRLCTGGRIPLPDPNKTMTGPLPEAAFERMRSAARGVPITKEARRP